MKKLYSIILLIVAITLLSPLFSSGQEVLIPADKKKEMHHEMLDDIYLPNAYNNNKISPAYKYKSTVASKLMSSSIFTNQVNVNASGQNILGDAANEPNIAVNPLNQNEIVIGWRQFDNVSSNFRQAGWSYTFDAGLTWTFPGVIEPGIFRSDPVLDYDNSGNFYYNSLTNTPDYFCTVFESTDGGATWNSGTPAGGGDKQWMTIDRTAGPGSGNIYSSWTSFYSTCPPGFFTRSTNGGSSFENCTVVDGDPYWGTMAVGNAGELYIAGGSILSDSIVVAKSLNAQIPASLISWNLPVSVFMDGYLNGWLTINPQGLLGQVNIDVDRSSGPGQGNVYVLASVTRLSISDYADVMFAKSTDGGLTWGSPIRINDDPSIINIQWFGTMSVAPNGRIDVIWLDTRDAPSGSDSSALYYSYSIDQGNTWTVNEKLSASFDPHIGYPNQNKMGDYFDMVSDNSGAHLAWANTFNGEQDVYYSHIIPQIAIGVNEIAIKDLINIFPNPFSAQTTLRTNNILKNATLTVYNCFGQTVKQIKNISGQTVTLFRDNLPSGLYFVRLTENNKLLAVDKLVITDK